MSETPLTQWTVREHTVRVRGADGQPTVVSIFSLYHPTQARPFLHSTNNAEADRAWFHSLAEWANTHPRTP